LAKDEKLVVFVRDDHVVKAGFYRIPIRDPLAILQFPNTPPNFTAAEFIATDDKNSQFFHPVRFRIRLLKF
jgi:hypothetical protein